MTDVFISYSRKDKEFVSTLYAAFERSKKNIWVDWNNIPLTSDWWLEIEKGIEAADTFLFVISPDSVASNVCAREIHHAVKNNKRLFPIVRRDVHQFEEGNVAHATLQKHNWLMFREEDDFKVAFEKLTKALSQDLEYLRKHKQLLVKAIDWNDSLRTDSLLLREDALYEAEIWLAESKTKDPQATELQEAFIERSRHIEDEQNREKIIFLENALEKGNMRAKIGLAILVGTIVLAAGAGISAIKLLNESNDNIKTGIVKLESVKASFDFKTDKNFKSLLGSLSAGKKLNDFKQSSILIKDNSDMYILSSLSQAVYGINEFNQFTFPAIIYSVAFSHNGKIIAVGLEDGTLRLLNLESNDLSLLRAHKARVWSVAFSPNDKMIVSGSGDNTAKL